MATNTPSQSMSLTSPVLTFFSARRDAQGLTSPVTASIAVSQITRLGWANRRACRMASARSSRGDGSGSPSRRNWSGTAPLPPPYCPRPPRSRSCRDRRSRRRWRRPRPRAPGTPARSRDPAICLGASGDDHGLGQEHRAGIAFQPERTLRQVGGEHDVVDAFGAHVLGLAAHLLHQPGPWITSAKPG